MSCRKKEEKEKKRKENRASDTIFWMEWKAPWKCLLGKLLTQKKKNKQKKNPLRDNNRKDRQHF